jgi:hypothetical protein
LRFFDDYARKSLHHPIEARELATLFELNERTARKILLHSPEQPDPLGRYMALNSEVESSLVLMLLDAFHEAKAMVQEKFLKIVSEQQNSELTKG